MYDSLKVVVLGDVLLDVYRHCEVSRLAPEAPVPVLDINEEKRKLGGSLNVVSVCLSLGAVVYPLIIADDDFLQELEVQTILNNRNCKKSLIYPGNSQVSYKYRYVNTGKLVARADRDSTIITPIHIEADIAKQIGEIAPNLVIISDYDKGTLTPSLVETVISYCNESRIVVALDPKPRFDSRIYSGVTVMTPNFPEAMRLCGISNRFKSSDINDNVLRDVFTALYDRYKPVYPLITLGKEGSALFSPSDNRITQISTHPTDVFDVTGAGDVYISILALELALGMSINAAMSLAGRLASLSVGYFGNYVPTQLDVAMCLKGIPLNSEGDLSPLLPGNRGSKKLVFTNGCFDIFHYGHLYLLRESKKRGDILVVGLNSDDSIKRLKGVSRPINLLEHRYELLMELGCVDHVIPFDEDTPVELIKLLRPNLLVKGGDYRIEDIIGSEYCDETTVVPYLPSLSTSNTIRKMKS